MLDAANLDSAAVIILSLVALAVLGLFILIMIENLQAPARRQQEAEYRYQRQREKKLEEAQALSLATDGFSEAACQARALAGLEELLKAASKIEEDESKRRLTERAKDAEYAEIAKYGVSKCYMDELAITEMLRAADMWPYRVLEMAKILQPEEYNVEN